MSHMSDWRQQVQAALAGDPGGPELIVWRRQAARLILIVVVVLGLPAWGSVVIGAWDAGAFTPLVGLYVVVYLGLLALALLPRIDHRLRVWGLLFLAYANGWASLARLGLAGSGRLYLLAAPLFSVVLAGRRAGVATTLISLASYALFATRAPAGAAASWIEAGIALAVFVICTALLVGRFVQFQLQTLRRERQARVALESARAELEATNRTLESRVLERTAALEASRQQAEATSRRLERELQFAGRVQASFMTAALPQIPSWECAAALVPARETSGDFYDVFALPDGNYGILIGDVVDKGVGAALFMALCWALLHTYARQHPKHPARVLAATNARILRDTHGDQFVTVFYGVLNPRTGSLHYANAGHNPPYHLGADRLAALSLTGIPLGILEDAHWQEQTVAFQPHDICLFYTDGVTEAQNHDGEFFEQSRLTTLLRHHAGRSAAEIRRALLGELAQFTGDVAQSDDVTLIVMAHANGSGPPATGLPEVPTQPRWE